MLTELDSSELEAETWGILDSPGWAAAFFKQKLLKRTSSLGELGKQVKACWGVEDREGRGGGKW